MGQNGPKQQIRYVKIGLPDLLHVEKRYRRRHRFGPRGRIRARAWHIIQRAGDIQVPRNACLTIWSPRSAA
jgi:hypothetical protein